MPRQNIINTSVRYLLFLTLFLISFVNVSVQAQEPAVSPQSPSTGSIDQPDISTPPSSIFSIEGGNKLMTEAEQAIDAQNYDQAAQKLQSARQVFNQLSNLYLQLFNSTSELDNVAADSHRKKALETSISRDEATYQLALVHRAQNKSELSIPLLIQIVTSQSPGIGLGKKAYDQLLEIGFVDVPITIPKSQNNSAPDSTPNQNNSAPDSTPNQNNSAPAPQTPANPQQPGNPEVQPAVPDPAIPDSSIPSP